MDVTSVEIVGNKTFYNRTRNRATKPVKFFLGMTDWSLFKTGVVEPCFAKHRILYYSSMWYDGTSVMEMELKLYSNKLSDEPSGRLIIPKGVSVHALFPEHVRNKPPSSTLAYMDGFSRGGEEKNTYYSSHTLAGDYQVTITCDRRVIIRPYHLG